MTAPAWCRGWVRYVVPRERRDDVLGDLEEVHARRQKRLGPSAVGRVLAWFGTSAEALFLGGAFLFYRLQEKGFGMPWTSWTEIRLGLRLIRKQPIMAATSILALATGMAVATTGFTFVDALFNGELPFHNGDRFVRLDVRSMPVGWSRSLDLERYHLFQQAENFEYLGAYDREDFNLLHPSGNVETAVGTWITPEVFRYLPYVPRLGRGLTAADGEIGAAPVAVLRESLWQRRYGGRHDVLGEVVNVNGQDYMIVGVLGDDAGFPSNGELWLPLDDRYLGGTAEGPMRGLESFAILREGVTLAAARQEIQGISTGFEAEHPPKEKTRLSLVGFTEGHPEEKLSAVMMTAVLLLLLVVIASNVANLVLARTASRTSELALRTALGAARTRLIGQLAAEVVTFGVIAAGLGLMASQLACRWLEPYLEVVPFWMDLRLNPRILAFTVGLSLLASVVGGVLPALKATRRNPATALQAVSRPGGHFGLGRLGTTMMVVEMALAVAMLSAALVIAQGLSSFMDQSYELPRGSVLTARLVAGEQPSTDGDGKPLAPTAHLAKRMADAVEAIPGVVASGVGSTLPGRDAASYATVIAPEVGEPPAEPRQALVARVRPGFLETFEARLLAGRLFQDADLESGALPVAVVNEPFVHKFLGGRNPIGRRLAVVSSDSRNEPEAWREIVGVVPDLGLSSADPERAAGYYVPQTGNPRAFHLALRTEGDPAALSGALRRAIVSIDPNIRITRVLPLEEVTKESRSLVAAFGTALVAVGAMVLILSLAGIYAMISFAVTRRTREIGIRVALGATRSQVLQAIVGSAGFFLTLGGGLGVVLTAAFMRLKDELLTMRLPSDELRVVMVVLGLLLMAGLAACWVPAQRALRIVPTEALRFD